MSRPPVVLHLTAVEYTAHFLLLPQLRALQERGYDVRLGCAPGPEGWSPALAPFSPVDVRFPRSAQPLRMAAAVRRLVHVVRELEPDVLHLHSPAAALPARCVPRRLLPARTRIAYTVHGFAHRWESAAARDRSLERAERALAGRADVLLLQSAEDHAAAQQHGYRTRLVHLGNGVQEEWFDPPAEPQRSVPLRVLFVGRLVREKGLLDLVDAVARVPGLHLSIAGGELPSERDGVGDELRRRAAEPGLAGRVELLGVLAPAALRAALRAADVMVLPSYREGVPRSVIEALAVGTPVVASDIRGCRELVQHGSNGYLVRPGDPAALAAALLAVARLPDDDYAALRRAAARSAETHRETRVVDRLVQAYADLGVPPPDGSA